MKIPSRFMPKYRPEIVKFTWREWIFFILFLFIIGFMFWAKPFALLAVIFVFAFGYILNIIDDKKLQKIALKRKNYNIGDFAKSFDLKNTDTWIIRAVYEELQDCLSIKNFPIFADDNITKLFHIDGEEIDELLEIVAQRTGRSLENLEQNPYFNTEPTARNIVLLLNKQKIIETKEERIKSKQ